MANYYNEKTLSKFSAALKEAKKEVKTGTITAPSISNGNVKMGNVASVSTLPFITCPGRCKETCGSDCYAAKIANLRTSVLKSYARNTALLMVNPSEYWDGIRKAAAGVRFFRFHVSGDILSAEYFDEMTKTADMLPKTDFLVFTKRYEIVNAWIRKNGELPANLHVLFSGWSNLKPVNPYNLPETNIFTGPDDFNKNWIVCGGNCFECACAGLGCWKASRGETVAFKKH